MEIIIIILETKDLDFPCNITFWKINSCIKVISASNISSYEIEERIAWNIMMSDISLPWHVTNETITQSVYLHKTKNLIGIQNHDSRHERHCLSM